MADSVATLRPNATVASDWAINGGAGSAHAATSDNSDATWVNANGANIVLKLDVGTTTIPTNAVIRSLQVRLRYTGSGFSDDVSLHTAAGETPIDTVGNQGSITTVTFTAQNTSPSGAAWTQADIDAVQVWIRPVGTIAVYEVYVDVYYNQVPVTPTVTVTPASPITSTSYPTVGATYSDPEGDGKLRFQVKTFSSAQYGAVGFDPETSTATDNSGVVVTSGTGAVSYTLTTALTSGGTYKSYVKISDLGSGNYSAWGASSAYTLVLGVPATPTIVATNDNVNNKVTLAVQGRDNLLSANQASVETDTVGIFAETNCTISRITSISLDGAAALQITAIAAADARACTSQGAMGAPVLPSTAYSALASFRGISANKNCYVELQWYDSSGVLINVVDGSQITSTTVGWTQATVSGTSPSNAAYAAVSCRVVSMAASGTMGVDQIGMFPGSVSTWSPGGFINHNNLLSENTYSIEASSAGWAAQAGGNCTVSRITTQYYESQSTSAGASLALTSSAAGQMSAETPRGTSGIPVAPNVTYEVYGMMRAATVARAARVDIGFFDSAGTLLNYTTATNVNNTTTGWTRSTIASLTSPANAAYANVVLLVATTAGAGEVHYFDAIVSRQSTPVVTTQIQRSIDSGTTWSNVRNANALTLTLPAQSALITDYEAPRGTSLQYQARITGYVGASSLTGSYSSTSSTTITNDGNWWMKLIADGTYNTIFYPKGPNFNRKIHENIAVFNPIGRSRNVVITDTILGDQFPLIAMCTTQAQYDAIIAIRSRQDVVLIQDPIGRQWYTRFLSDFDVNELYVGNPPYREVGFAVIEVDAP